MLAVDDKVYRIDMHNNIPYLNVLTVTSIDENVAITFVANPVIGLIGQTKYTYHNYNDDFYPDVQSAMQAVKGLYRKRNNNVDFVGNIETH